MNQTPLMAAAAAGNVPLVQALLDRGANLEAVDHYGQNALHWALRQGFGDAKFAAGPLAPLYHLLAPAVIDVNTGEHLVRIDRHVSEYFLFQTMWALFKDRFTHLIGNLESAFQTQIILTAWQHLPAQVLRPERNKRAHLSSVLSRNEIERDYAYNRSLFLRVGSGRYQFNPLLSVRQRTGDQESWVPIYTALNLPLINEFAFQYGNTNTRKNVQHLLKLANLPLATTPIAIERLLEREAAERRAREEENARFKALENERINRLKSQEQSKSPSTQRRSRRPSVEDLSLKALQALFTKLDSKS